MWQFEDEYKEDLVLSIYNCAKGSDGLVNNSEFENLYYLMQVDSPSDVSFCLLDINSDGQLSLMKLLMQQISLPASFLSLNQYLP